MNIAHLAADILQQAQSIQSQAQPMQQPHATFWNGPASNWFVAFGTLALAFAAVLQEPIKRWLFRPVLEIKVRAERPLAEKTASRYQPTGLSVDVYYFRLAVTNVGRKAAEDVQVYAYAIKRKGADKKYNVVDRFTPMALRWTHKNGGTLPYLLPKMPPVYCDLGHISDPARKTVTSESLSDVPPEQTVFVLETEVNPNSKGNVFGPGEYYVYVTVAASNCRPRDFKIKIKTPTGKWFADEEHMFHDGIGLSL